ncbi:hypothetical protein S83_070588, partial [Arachis hypogaea]
MYNWPYPISLTMIHMAFCSSLAYIFIYVLKLVEPISMSRDLYLRSVVPISCDTVTLSPTRDCVLQERNSFVNFQAKTGVEFITLARIRLFFDVAEYRTVSGVAGPLVILDKVKVALVLLLPLSNEVRVNGYGGSEQYHLHSPGRTPLSWRTRIQIAIDVANALEYLHLYCDPPLCHRDIKSSNIFLDENFVAK